MVNTPSERAAVALRTCERCVSAYFGAGGCFCVAYVEFVDDEIRAAADCPLYEPGAEK